MILAPFESARYKDFMTKTAKSLLAISVTLTFMILATFAIWGDAWDQLWSLEASASWFENHPHTAGVVAVGLLIGDLVLPVPTTAIIGGLAAATGFLTGFAYGWLGLVLAGLAGFCLARLGNRRLANWIASPDEQKRWQAWFDQWGSFAIIISRMLPILPEVMSVLAGLYGMRFSRVLPALLLGSFPAALAFSWLGSQSRSHPGPALWGFVLLTGVMWLLYLRLIKSRSPAKG